MELEITQLNRLGNRETNEDRLVVVERDQSVLMVVADGMGGHRGGDIAAQIFVDTLERFFRKVSLPLSSPKLFLEKAINAAHKIICQEAADSNTKIDPRTTCVACILQGQSAYWAHVGDSRLYLIRDNKVLARTIDHSYVEDLFRQGLISEADMLTHPKRSYLTQCIGGTDHVPNISYGNMETLKIQDIFILCSDGFWTAINQQSLHELAKYVDLEKAINNLATLAESSSYPQSDNISAIALRIKGFADRHVEQTDSSNTQSIQTDNVDHAVAAITQALEDYQNEMDYDPDTK